MHAAPGLSSRLLRPVLFTLASLLLCVSCLIGEAQAQQRLEIIPLQHRLAEQVLPVLQPLVPSGSSISAMDNKLVVRASPQVLAQIRQVLSEIDKPARRLMITVKQGELSESDRRAAGISGDVAIRNGNVDADVRGGISARSSTMRNDGSSQVQTLEGSNASIYLGTSLALPMTQVAVGPGGALVSTGTQFVDVGSGFQARPQLAGNNVTVTISPQSQRLSSRGMEGSNLSTTVSGRLGEWIRLGGAAETRQQDGRSLGGYSASAGQRSNEVWMRVEALD